MPLCIRAGDRGTAKVTTARLLLNMSEHLAEQELRIADPKHPAGKIETSLSGMQCGTEIRPAPNLCMNTKAGSNCREVCKKITASGTGDGCQRQTAPEPVAASNGETESLKTPQKKNCKSQSRWPQGRTSCHTQQAHNVPSLPVPDPQQHATLVSTRPRGARPPSQRRILMATKLTLENLSRKLYHVRDEHRYDSIIMNGLIAGIAPR